MYVKTSGRNVGVYSEIPALATSGGALYKPVEDENVAKAIVEFIGSLDSDRYGYMQKQFASDGRAVFGRNHGARDAFLAVVSGTPGSEANNIIRAAAPAPVSGKSRGIDLRTKEGRALKAAASALVGGGKVDKRTKAGKLASKLELSETSTLDDALEALIAAGA